MQREREQLQAVLSELRVAEGEAASLKRDDERLARDLAEIAAARAEREALARELAPYEALHAEFQRLELLAREEGRRQALLETRASVERGDRAAARAPQEDRDRAEARIGDRRPARREAR